MTKNNISRRQFLKYSALSLSLLCIGGTGAAYSSNVLETTNQVINTGKLSTPLKLLHFSDLHLSKDLSQKLLEDTIKQIKASNVDIICFTGDVISDGPHFAAFIAGVFSEFSPKLGTFAVLGNHDYFDYKQAKLVINGYNKAGVNVLINESLKIKHNGETISILGADDIYYGNQDLNKTFKNHDEGLLNICMTHNPTNIVEISKFNPDIVLSGHTHGGQIYIPYILDRFYRVNFDPRYIRGVFKINNTVLNVNRGIGATKSRIFINKKEYIIPPKRLFSRPEISLITIT